MNVSGRHIWHVQTFEPSAQNGHNDLSRVGGTQSAEEVIAVDEKGDVILVGNVSKRRCWHVRVHR